VSTTFDAVPAAGIDLSGSYTFDTAHSRFGFQARHAMVTTVRGHFEDFTGTVTLDEANPTSSSVDITIQVKSITTSQADRDNHLRSSDFFDPETYPTITFRSTTIERVEGEDYKVTGDLTIKGVAKPVTLDLTFTGAAKDNYGNARAGFEGSAVVNRKEWNLVWNVALETGGVLVSDKVKLDFDISLIKNA